MRLRGHIESVGKRRLDESGKYPVNENDEESLQRLFPQGSYSTCSTPNRA